VDDFISNKLEFEFKEHYYSASKKNVVRGLHFQLPPMDHVKIVYCIYGAVLDVVLDLRIDSPSYGDYEIFELSAEKANSIYMPKGMAHGFCVLSQEAILGYCVTSTYSQECDSGIRWDSANIPWPVSNPILSVRDLALPSFGEFKSPFKYEY
jgi:dTDP-4-dehydrorhamnose 3,5-epimerase